MAENGLKAFFDIDDFQQGLLFIKADIQMTGNRIGQLNRVVNLTDIRLHFRRNFAVELHIAIKLADGGAHQRTDFFAIFNAFGDHQCAGLKKCCIIEIIEHFGARLAFNQNFHSAIRQLQHLQHRADCTDFMHIGGLRIVLITVFLADQQHVFVIRHNIFKRANGFFAPDKKRHNHAGEDNDIAQRQYRQDDGVFGLLFEVIFAHYFNFPFTFPFTATGVSVTRDSETLFNINVVVFHMVFNAARKKRPATKWRPESRHSLKTRESPS